MDQVTQKTLSERPSKTLESLISTRLARLSAILARPVEDITRRVWVDAVKFLMPSQIEAAFDRLEASFIPTSACPFPVPANLLAFIEHATSNQLSLDAERAWDDLLLWMQRYYRPDCRDMKYPLMESRMVQASIAAGGLEHISSCPIAQLPWAKKAFIGAYLGLGKLEEDQPLLGSPKVMKQLGAVAEGKQLK